MSYVALPLRRPNLISGLALFLALAITIAGPGAARASTAGGHPAVGAGSTGGALVDENGKPCGCEEPCGAGPAAEGANASTNNPSSGDPGKPVEIVSGRVYSHDVDLVVNGVFPIRVVRYYDSQTTYDSPLGHGWALGFNMGAYREKDGHYTVRMRCGNRSRYEFNDVSETFSPSASANAAGRVADFQQYLITEDDGQGSPLDISGHELRQPGGERIVFDQYGRVYAVYDALGNKHQYSYEDAAGGSPQRFPLIGSSPYASRPEKLIQTARYYRLTGVREYLRDGSKAISDAAAYVDTGRYVTFVYDDAPGATGRLISVVAHASDMDDRRVDYFHQEMAAGVDPVPGLAIPTTLYRGLPDQRYLGNLTRVEFPLTDGPTPRKIVEEYEYRDADPLAAASLRDYHNLTKVTFGDGLLPWYYEYGDVGSGTADRVIRHYHGVDGSDWLRQEWNFEYVQDEPTQIRNVTRLITTPDRDDPTLPTAPNKIVAEALVRYEYSTDDVMLSREVYDTAAVGAGTSAPLLWRTAYVRESSSPFLDRIVTCTQPKVGSDPAECNGPIRTVELQYDSAGNLFEREVTLFDAETITESWTYDAPVGQGDPFDPNWAESYQISSNVVDSSGSPQAFVRTTPIDVTSDNTRRTVASSTRSDGGVTPADSQTESYEYDAIGGRLTKTVLPETAPGSADQIAVCLTYFNDPVAKESFGLLESLQLDVSGTSCAAPLDPHLARSVEYDSRGLVNLLVDARGNESTLQTDRLGRIVQIANAKNEVTTLRYSGPNVGIADSASWPEGRLLAEVELEAAGSSSPVRIRFIYDARENLIETQIDDVDDGQGGFHFATLVSRFYDSDGNRILQMDAGRAGADPTLGSADATRTELYFDAVRRLEAVIASADPTPYETRFEYDPFGNRKRVQNVFGATTVKDTTFVFDELDRLRQIDEPGPGAVLTTTFTYDARGDMTSVEEPNEGTNRTTLYRYDGLSRLREVRAPDYAAGTNNHRMLYSYDGRSRLSRIENGRGHAIDRVHAAWGGLTAILSYDTVALADLGGTPARTVRFSYDDVGNLLSTSDDAVTFGTLPAASTNGDGDLLLADRLYTHVYDELDRVTSVTAHFVGGTPGIELTSDYDARGNRTTLALNQTQLVQETCFNRRDRISQLQTLDVGGSSECGGLSASSIAFSYYANGQPKATTFPGGISDEIGYFRNGPFKGLYVTDAVAGDLLILTHTLNELQNVDSITETIPAATGVYDYDYDEAERLTSATYPTHTGLSPDSLVYDARGNRDNDNGSGMGAGDYVYDDANRLLESPTQAANCYDEDGNLLETWSGPGCQNGTLLRSYVWDRSNRLSSVSESGLLGTYQYDPMGRRIAKSAGGVTTFYLWDGDRLFAELDGSSVLQRRYEYADGFAPVRATDGPAAQCGDGIDNDGDGSIDFAGSDPGCSSAIDQTEGTELMVHSDHLDTPRVITDTNGAVVWRAAYAAFGEAVVDPDPDGDLVDVTFNTRFPGQYFDAETGLHYNWHRYYDPSLGRYISADPIGQLGGVNVYTYALNSPTSFVDPYGLFNVAEGLVNRFSGGGDVDVPFSEVDPGVSPSDFPGFDEAVANTPPGGSTEVDLNLGVDVGDVDPGLGRVNFNLTGTITRPEGGGDPCFDGEVTADPDPYDFNPEPDASFNPSSDNFGGPRGVLREAVTRAVNGIPGGSDFNVNITGGRPVSGRVR